MTYFFYLLRWIVPFSFKARLLNTVWTDLNKNVVFKTELK